MEILFGCIAYRQTRVGTHGIIGAAQQKLSVISIWIGIHHQSDERMNFHFLLTHTIIYGTDNIKWLDNIQCERSRSVQSTSLFMHGTGLGMDRI